MKPPAPRHVTFLAYDGVSLIDVSGPMSALIAADYPPSTYPPYSWSLVSAAGGPVATYGGLVVQTAKANPRRAADTLVVPGGHFAAVERAAADRNFLKVLTTLAGPARRVCSVCTGAHLLAAAGLLAGKRAATHWAYCGTLAGRYPDVTVDADAVYLRDGRVWTSAGVTAGIDLALALVEDDLGRAVASRAARGLVVYLRRPAGQSQFSTLLRVQSATDGGRFDALHQWVEEHLTADLRVEKLAERVHMSPRNFARVYRAVIGQTPAKVVEGMRVEAARRRLVDTREPFRQVARACGFADEEGLRVAFARRLGVSPREYRQRFA